MLLALNNVYADLSEIYLQAKPVIRRNACSYQDVR